MHLDTELKGIIRAQKGPNQNSEIMKFFKQKDDFIVNTVNDTIKTTEFTLKHDISEQV